MRDLLLVLHVLGAALWIGGGVLSVMGRRNMVAGDSSLALSWMRFEEKLGKTFFPVASVLTLLTGIGLVIVAEEYTFTSVFVLIGFAVFVISAVMNGALAPKIDAQAVAAWEEGDAERGRQLIAKSQPFQTIDVVIVLIALFVMVYRLGA